MLSWGEEKGRSQGGLGSGRRGSEVERYRPPPLCLRRRCISDLTHYINGGSDMNDVAAVAAVAAAAPAATGSTCRPTVERRRLLVTINP